MLAILPTFSQPSRAKANVGPMMNVYWEHTSAIRPVPHSDELPISEPREIDLLSSDNAESSEECSVSEPCTSRNKKFGITTEPHLINESKLNDLVRDLDLPKVKAELLASRLKQWNLLESGVKVCSFCTRQQSLAQFFKHERGTCMLHRCWWYHARIWVLRQTRRMETVY